MKPTRRPAYSWLASAGAAGFVAGMLVMAALFTIFPAGTRELTDPLTEAASGPPEPIPMTASSGSMSSMSLPPPVPASTSSLVG